MAAATITKTEWGFEITGGTSATLVQAGKIWISAVALSANAAGDTVVATSGSLNNQISCFQMKAVNPADVNSSYIALYGTPFDNVTVTLSATSVILYIYLKF